MVCVYRTMLSSSKLGSEESVRMLTLVRGTNAQAVLAGAQWKSDETLRVMMFPLMLPMLASNKPRVRACAASALAEGISDKQTQALLLMRELST